MKSLIIILIFKETFLVLYILQSFCTSVSKRFMFNTK